MFLLTSTSDKIRVVTGSAGTIHVHASFMDLAAGAVTPLRTNTASIGTATTTDVVGAPASSTSRKVKALSVYNADAAVTNTVTIQHYDGTTAEELWKGALAPGEGFIYTEGAGIQVFASNGGPKTANANYLFNASTTSQGAGFAADTYVTGSFIAFPQAPKVGTKYRLRFDVSKTGAGIAAPILQVRFGTAGSTADTSRNSITFNAQTANTDVGYFEVEGVFRSVGGGTSAVFQVTAIQVHSNSTTGLGSTPSQVGQSTSGGFDSTVTGLGVGVSINGGTSAAWTVQGVYAELLNAA